MDLAQLADESVLVLRGKELKEIFNSFYQLKLAPLESKIDKLITKKKEVKASLTVKEVAKFIGRSTSFVYNNVKGKKDRRMPYYKIGDNYFFNPEEVTAWMRTGYRKTRFEAALAAIDARMPKN